MLACVGLLFAVLVVGGARVSGNEVARAVLSRLLCAASLADGCGDEPVLIAAYGAEVGRLARERMPTLAFEAGSRAVPVDFRRCRSAECGDAGAEGNVHRTGARLPVTAFVHVVDCRADEAVRSEAEGADCSGRRAGNLYLQYWTYYADSATLRDVPVAGRRGYHRDDWESVQLRIRPDGAVDQRASSHHGFNHGRSAVNWGSDAGVGPLRSAAEALGARERGGWGPASGLHLVSGGSHAGNVGAGDRGARFVPGRRVHLIPLESIAATSRTPFAVSPPWRKKVWLDPEAEETD